MKNKMAAIHLNIRPLSNNEEDKNAKLHLMPCIIKKNGEAKVSTFFEPIIHKNEEGFLQSSFRGYPLIGKELNIPNNYCGIVLKETVEKLSEEAERDLYATHMFNKFTYWNWDTEPSTNDKVVMALDWLDVSKALHSTDND